MAKASGQRYPGDLVSAEPSAGERIDAEYKVLEYPRSHRKELRLWLRLLTCTKLMETEIRQRLRDEFGMTLPRFDLMAQLERAADGLSLSELSERLMVTNGNVTGLVERLAREGFVSRVIDEKDRRAARVHLTEAGRGLFGRMALAHRAWISDLFAGVAADKQDELWDDLGDVKVSIYQAMERPPQP